MGRLARPPVLADITAILNESGLPEAVGNGLGGVSVSGWRAYRTGRTVRVFWISHLSQAGVECRAQEAVLVARCASLIRAGGWQVTGRYAALIVTRPGPSGKESRTRPAGTLLALARLAGREAVQCRAGGGE